jgi:hypothetical protein
MFEVASDAGNGVGQVDRELELVVELVVFVRMEEGQQSGLELITGAILLCQLQ